MLTRSPNIIAASSWREDRRRRKRTVRASFALMSAWVHRAAATVHRSRPPISRSKANLAECSQVSASSRSLVEDFSVLQGPRELRIRDEFLRHHSDRDDLEPPSHPESSRPPCRLWPWPPPSVGHTRPPHRHCCSDGLSHASITCNGNMQIPPRPSFPPCAPARWSRPRWTRSCTGS